MVVNRLLRDFATEVVEQEQTRCGTAGPTPPAVCAQLPAPPRPSYTRSQMQRDRAVAHMLVLALHADRFAVEVEPIAKDLKQSPSQCARAHARACPGPGSTVPAQAQPTAAAHHTRPARPTALPVSPRVAELLRYVGCKVESSDAAGEGEGAAERTYMAQLVAPLQFPKPRRKRGRK